MPRFNLVLTTLMTTSVIAWAHGENTPGPHGGNIQMPSNFHTEVIQTSEKKFNIYLLDIKFQNPITKNSTVAAKVIEGKKFYNLVCTPQLEYFECIGARPLKSGTLVIQAERDGTVAGLEAKYSLPLKKLSKPNHKIHH
ncbi:MAG: hypothetical protein K2P92_06205 [Bdellovibrionaceae bacterium]|nr:hypothetical protein [Pseudobdellovibrionaceae bacterium]